MDGDVERAGVDALDLVRRRTQGGADRKLEHPGLGHGPLRLAVEGKRIERDGLRTADAG